MLSGRCICDGPITRPEEFYRVFACVCVCVCVCVGGGDREASIVMRPGPLGGRHTIKIKCDCRNHMEHGTYIYQEAICG